MRTGRGEVQAIGQYRTREFSEQHLAAGAPIGCNERPRGSRAMGTSFTCCRAKGIPMIVMTTSSSTRVKPRGKRWPEGAAVELAALRPEPVDARCETCADVGLELAQLRVGNELEIGHGVLGAGRAMLGKSRRDGGERQRRRERGQSSGDRPKRPGVRRVAHSWF